MIGSRTRARLIATAVSPLVVLGVGASTAAPASATVIEAECAGVAPLQPTCTTTGTFGPAGTTVQVGSGINVGYTGDLTVTITSATMTWTWSFAMTAGVLTTDYGTSQSGGWQPGQSFTLAVSAPGTGYYDAYVDEG